MQFRFQPQPDAPCRPGNSRAHSAFIAKAGLLLLLAAGCQPDQTDDMVSDTGGHQHGTQAGGANASPDETKYQCSMHPFVVDDEPGTCRVCGMDLQPVKKSRFKGIPGRDPVELDLRQRQLINIRTVKAEKRPAERTIRTVGVIHHDTSKVFTISAWTDGRIENLYVDKPEMRVDRGDLLYAIYSPRLYSTMQDYVSLLRRERDNRVLIESTRKRLRLLGLSADQIERLADENQAPTAIEVPSPAAGLVMRKSIQEGDYVREGDQLYTVVDLSSLWLIVTVYQPEINLIRAGTEVIATTTAYPGETFTGEVEVINHHIDHQTRSAELRVVFNQPEQLMRMTKNDAGKMEHHHRLLPDMYMNAEIQIPLGKSLLVPASAVFDTGTRQYVFVQRDEGLFVPEEIVAGERSGDHIVIRKGLSEGDPVVVDGNFLLDSESQLKAAASGSFQEDSPAEVPPQESKSDADADALTEAEPRSGSTNVAATMGSTLPEGAEEPWASMLSAYLSAGEALVHDREATLSQPVEEMRAGVERILQAISERGDAMEKVGPILKRLQAELAQFEPGNLEGARVAYGRVSEALIQLVRALPRVTEQALHVVECPMWEKSSGRWLQDQREITNPFMGQSMPKCGQIVETIE